MRVAGVITQSAATIALLMAIVGFALGSAPFTPALALAAAAIPIALITFWLGMRRLSLAAIYWAVAAFLPVPLSDWFPVQVDTMLLILAVSGVALSSLVFFNYVRAKRQLVSKSVG